MIKIILASIIMNGAPSEPTDDAPNLTPCLHMRTDSKSTTSGREGFKSLISLDGQKFSRLTVVKRADSKNGSTMWLCRCECGNEKVINGNSLRRGLSTSCGCLQKERAAEAQRKHGMTDSPEYNVWMHMKRRCQDEKYPDFKNWGGRGIKVCERWMKFENFLADMGERPPGTSIDRINNDGNYEPGNCRWATHKEQCRNTRKNIHYALDGKTMTVAEWAESTGLGATLRVRLAAGWSFERAIKQKVRTGKYSS